VGPARTPAIPLSPGEADTTQINSAVNTPGGIAIGAAVPAAPLVLNQAYGDLQSTAPYPSVMAWTPQGVYDVVMFTQEFQASVADLGKLQFEVTSNQNVNYRFLIHTGNDFDQEFPGGSTQSNTLGTGWYASDIVFGANSTTYSSPASADGSNVWSTLSLNAQTANWYTASLLNWSTGGGFSVAGTTSVPNGTVTAFGIYVVNPSGNQRFDNYTIENVPEPMAISLLGLGALAMLRRSR
jgi:hypothetical protein